MATDAMASDDGTARRPTELEIKASFTEDLLDQLNQIIVHQQQQIDELICEVSELQQRMPTIYAVQFRSLRDELPPHY